MKILPLPVRFDGNEWFVIVSILLFGILFCSLPKRFPTILTLTLWLFNMTLSKSADYTLAAALPFDLYDYSDTSKLDLFDEVLQFFLYPLVGYLMLHAYDVWREKRHSRLLFVILAVGASVLYEWISVQFFHVFTYKGWHLSYSAIAYVFLISSNIFFLSRLKKWLPKAP